MGKAEILVSVRSSPFRTDRKDVHVPSGVTVEELVEATGFRHEDVAVAVNGAAIERAAWPEVTPFSGAHVSIVRRPAGFVLQVANMVASAYTSLRGLKALFRMLVPPPPEPGDTVTSGRRITIQGATNELRRYETVEQVLGKYKVLPSQAAATYTLVEGDKLYQYSLLCFGPGPLELTNFKLGEDPLFASGTSIAYTGQMTADTNRWRNITLEVRRGNTNDAAITLYTTDVQQTSVEAELRKTRGWIVRRTVDRTTRITVIIGFLNGLVWVRDDGSTKKARVQIEVQYRSATAAADAAWSKADEFNVAEENRNSLYRSRSWAVAEGTYDVRLRRITDEARDIGITDTAHWVTIVQQRAGSPVLAPGMCLVAVKAQITEQFSGLVNNLSAEAQTICLDWDSGTSSWISRATSNPASLIRHVLQGRSNRRPSANARLDLETFADFHEECAAKGFEFNALLRSASSVLAVCQMIAAAGRGSFGQTDGLFTVIWDRALTGSPAQTITPRNVIRFQGQKAFPKVLHGYRVQWTDPASDWLETERIVTDDGYTTSTATELERLDLPGVTNDAQAYKLGRYHLAQRRLRPEQFVVDIDFEMLDLLRGDWITLAHDAALLGLSWGRVTAVAVNGSGACTAITVDAECPMEALKSYEVQVRRTANGTRIVNQVFTVAGAQTTLSLQPAIASGDPQPAVGDLFAFGEVGVAVMDCKLLSVDPGENHGARLTLVPAAAAALTADSGTIPAYKPQISIPANDVALRPPKPLVAKAESAPSGSATSATVRVSLAPQRVAVQR